MIRVFFFIIFFSASFCQAKDQEKTSMTTQEQQYNRLIHEKSPYLLQHADNPVDWYPWGEEAFNKAKQEDKPIFLSIGYSTCHWCHVMEHESFEDKDIAALINQYFIPIKVDREERPDIDNIYMSAVTAMTGQGGWPLTVILTPDKKPFFGGTYFPPYAKRGQQGLENILESIHQAWMNERSKITNSSISLTAMLKQRILESGEKVQITETVFQDAFTHFMRNYDSQFGGFGYAPKFPTGHNLSFLLRHWKRFSEPKSLSMVEHTLEQMAKGGIYDHIGGGFHRYSTDHQWQVPHFEKMLYDQAILARTYLEAYQITKKEIYAQTAREIFDYVLRDMQDENGGFYSAEDADSFDPDEYEKMTLAPKEHFEKKEGAFYLWRYEEIIRILDKEEAEVFNYYFGADPEGNAVEDPHGEFTGKNIIYVKHDLTQTAQHFKKNKDQILQTLKRVKEKLFDVRTQRPHSHLDDKILSDWNGLMISSLAFGAKILHEPRYQQAAEKSARFILKNLITHEGRLQHRYRDGEAAILGTIEDYAFFIHGLLDLYEATFEIEYLQQAVRLGEDMLRFFWDKENGGFYFTAYDAEELLFRQKGIYDGAIPSGNSIAALNLVRLSHLTLNKQWEEKLEKLFLNFASKIMSASSAHAQMLVALDFVFGPSKEIVIASSRQEDVSKFHETIYDFFIPNKVILLHDTPEVSQISPFVQNQLPLGGKTTIYVCENHVCKLPVKELEAFKNMLKEF